MTDLSLTAIGGVIVYGAACGKSAREVVPRPLETLSPEEYATLAAACERVFPRDSGPGAIDLGVPDYIDHVLGDDRIREWRDAIRQGLALLETQARREVESSFHHASASAQDDLLRRWQQEGNATQRRFFDLLMTLTIEGVFADPIYGGNRNKAGWRMVGFVPDSFTPSKVGRRSRSRG